MKSLILSLSLILAVGLLVLSADRLNLDPQTNTMSDSPSPSSHLSDQDFLREMIEHHEGALSMAEEAKTKSSRPEIKAFASKVIAAQQAEIEQMYAWRENWFNDSGHVSMRMGADMPSMAVSLGSSDAHFDQRFLTAMITHHAGAITMAEQISRSTTRPELLALADAITTTQSQEITQMQVWLTEWYD